MKPKKSYFSIILIGLLLLMSVNGNALHAEDKQQIKETFLFKINTETKDESIQVYIPDTIHSVHADAPYLLPTKELTYTFPIDTEIRSIKATPSHIHHKITEHSPKEMPKPVMIGQVSSDINHQNTEQYLDKWISYHLGTGLYNDIRQKILTIRLHPVKYDEHTKTLTWCEQLDVSIDTVTSSTPSKENYQEEYSFLIITTGEYAQELSPLVNHKINADISTRLVRLSEITNEAYFPNVGRDLQEQIKYFIKNAIEQWNTTDVMLVGSSTDIPSRETHVQVSSNDIEIFVSDLYYADIYDSSMNFSSWDTNNNDLFAEYQWIGKTDSLDFYPDVRLGRLACINEQQVETVVSKIINYETEEAWTQNWFTNLVVIGGDTVPNDEKGIDEGELVNQKVIELLDTFIPDKIWDSNNRLGGISPSGVENIDNGINQGCGFVEFSGHGSPSVWTTYPHNGSRQSLPTPWGAYYNYKISDLINEEKLPIAFNGGCSMGKFNKNDDCFAWAWLSNPDGGGIASVGCTALGYIYIGEYVTEGLVEGMTINMVEAYVNGAVTFGSMWGNAMVEYIGPNMGGADWKTVLEWEPFGDPTLQIAEESIPPEKPEINGETNGKAGETYTYTAVATDIDETDQIYYLFDWGDDTFSEWIGPYGSGEEASIEHTWEERGDYQVRVRAKDTRGAVGEWSDPLPVKMPYVKQVYQFLPHFEFLQNFFNWFCGIIQC